MSTPDPVIPFDTHRFVKRMTGAGMPLDQAEVLAEENVALINSHLATRRDTDEIKRDTTRLKQNFEDLGKDADELKQNFKELRKDTDQIKRDVGQIKVDLAVVKTELTMMKWLVSGIGFGILLLLIRSFWPV